MEQQTGLAKTQNMICCLIDPNKSKDTQWHNLSVILYIASSAAEVLPHYLGRDSTFLNSFITSSEVGGAISAPLHRVRSGARKHKVIDGAQCSSLDARVILSISLTKAFHGVKHSAILEKLDKREMHAVSY